MIESEEVALGDGLRARPRRDAARRARPSCARDPYATVAVLRLEGAPGEGPALEHAGRRLRRLQTALRLWDDAEPSLGPVAWARTDGGPWLSVPLATGLRRAEDDCLLAGRGGGSAARVLRARRPPHPARGRAGLGAAPLRARLRARLGAVEALTDWLLAGRALLAEPTRPATSGLAERLAAICADARGARRARASACATRSSLERAAIAGRRARRAARSRRIVDELGGCLRAVLRDVLCGHLDPALRRLADEHARRETRSLSATVPVA